VVTGNGPNNASNGKHFVYDELLGRMRAVLRRSDGPRHARLTVRDLETAFVLNVWGVGYRLVAAA
jgi:hypothetical protein